MLMGVALKLTPLQLAKAWRQNNFPMHWGLHDCCDASPLLGHVSCMACSTGRTAEASWRLTFSSPTAPPWHPRDVRTPSAPPHRTPAPLPPSKPSPAGLAG